MTLPVPSLAHVFDVEVLLGSLEDHGDTRSGHRRVVPVIGGTITGDVDAHIIAGGADWQIVRPDGSIDIDGRYSARTSEGEFLYLHSQGVRSGDRHILEALLQGEQVDPSQYYFRTTVTIETAAPRLAHLQRYLFIAVAERTATSVRYSTYQLT